MHTKTICMLGEGAWGTAIALVLAQNGYTVKLWCYHADVAQEIQKNRYNTRYLPHYCIPESIIPVTNLQEAVKDVTWVFEAIPVKYMRSVLTQVKSFLHPHHQWVVLSKGIEHNTLLVPTQLIKDVTGNEDYVVLAGPSFAQEVAQQQPTGVLLASSNQTLIEKVQAMLNNRYFKTYMSHDVCGVQYTAAFKNVITLGIGMLDSAGYGDNTKAFFMTQSLHEMGTLICAIGGTQEIIYSLAGVGDVVLTSMGKLSRNLEVGRLLGKGMPIDAIIQQTGYTPEGINTLASVYQLSDSLSLKLPLFQALYQIVYNQLPITHLIEILIK